MLEIAQSIIEKGLSVRQVEKLSKNSKSEVKSDKVKKDIYIENIIKILETKLGSKINVKGSSTKGKIEIEFSSLEELNKIIGHIK